MWKNYVARGRALLGWRRMACALAAKVAGSRARGLQRLRKRTDGPTRADPSAPFSGAREGVNPYPFSETRSPQALARSTSRERAEPSEVMRAPARMFGRLGHLEHTKYQCERASQVRRLHWVPAC